jgi:hypothetical protein
MPKSPTRKKAALDDAIATASERSAITSAPTKKATARVGRIMYIECKSGDLTGPARIGRVTFSQTGRTLYYRGKKFQSLKGLASNQTTTTSKPATTIGFQGPNAMGVMLSMEEIAQSKSMTTSARNIGASFVDSPRESTSASPD